jgi:2-haloacid dehalogenase
VTQGLVLTAAAEDQLMNQYRHLSAFPENRDVLAALKRRGVPAGILSNGDPEMLGVAVKSAGFADLLQHVVSVHAVQKYKTDPAAYALGSAAFGLAAKDILFVSSNGWDAIGATWVGYTTLWVNRAGAPLEQLDTEPTRTGTSLRDVLTFFA